MEQKESIEGPLTALRNAGTVCGVCLSHGHEVIINLFPFSQRRIEEVVAVVGDIAAHFHDNGRDVDQLCFGYDGGNLVVAIDGDYQLVVMHMLTDEIDFIAKAARAFLNDFQIGLFSEQVAAGKNVRLAGILPQVEVASPELAPEPVSLPAEKPKTQPIQPPVKESIPEEPEIEAQPEVETVSEPPPQVQPRPVPAQPVTIPASRPAAAAAVAAAATESDPVHGARLAPSQPESTLPPPRKAKTRGS